MSGPATAMAVDLPESANAPTADVDQMAVDPKALPEDASETIYIQNVSIAHPRVPTTFYKHLPLEPIA